jgi:hypothetical protein
MNWTMTVMMMNRRSMDHHHSVSTCVQDAYGIFDLGYPTGSGSYCCQSCCENASDSVFSGYHFETENVNDDVSLAAGLCSLRLRCRESTCLRSTSRLLLTTIHVAMAIQSLLSTGFRL